MSVEYSLMFEVNRRLCTNVTTNHLVQRMDRHGGQEQQDQH